MTKQEDEDDIGRNLVRLLEVLDQIVVPNFHPITDQYSDAIRDDFMGI